MSFIINIKIGIYTILPLTTGDLFYSLLKEYFKRIFVPDEQNTYMKPCTELTPPYVPFERERQELEDVANGMRPQISDIRRGRLLEAISYPQIELDAFKLINHLIKTNRRSFVPRIQRAISRWKMGTMSDEGLRMIITRTKREMLAALNKKKSANRMVAAFDSERLRIRHIK